MNTAFNKPLVTIALLLPCLFATPALASVEIQEEGVASYTQEAMPDEIPASTQYDLINAQPMGLSGAGWTVSLSADGRKLTAIYVSGYFASGTFPQCQIVPSFSFKVAVDGQPLYQLNSNRFNLVFPNSTTCGLYYTFTQQNPNWVVQAGNWEFRVEQPANGSPVSRSFTVNACRAATPMFQTRNDFYTDYFYSTLRSERDAAINAFGYVDQGSTFSVESIPLQGTLPNKRFFKGAPQIEHFYSISAADHNVVLNAGWYFEGIEGYIYSTQKPATTALHRLNRWHPATSDLEHFYTTSDATKNAYLQQGWGYDGVVGYVCQ